MFLRLLPAICGILRSFLVFRHYAACVKKKGKTGGAFEGFIYNSTCTSLKQTWEWMYRDGEFELLMMMCIAIAAQIHQKQICNEARHFRRLHVFPIPMFLVHWGRLHSGREEKKETKRILRGLYIPHDRHPYVTWIVNTRINSNRIDINDAHHHQ